MSRWSEDSPRYRQLRRAFLEAHPVCWVCGHHGADQIDHDPPRAVHRAPLDVATWRPAHGTRQCPTCKRRCNQVRGTKPVGEVTPAFVPAFEW